MKISTLFKHKKNKKTSSLLTYIVSISFFVIWQVIAMIMNKPYILPSPIKVLVRLWELRVGLFTIHLPATLYVTALGLLIATILGIVLAIFMAEYEAIEKALLPSIIASQTIPLTAIAPLFILWFGYGIWSKVFVTILITFFPVTINLHEGLKSVKREQLELLKTYKATKMQLFLKLKLPTALPSFLASIKMAIPLSIIGAAIAEWLGGESGLGYYSKRMVTQLDGAAIFAPVVLLSVVAMILVKIVTIIEKKTITWRNEM